MLTYFRDLAKNTIGNIYIVIWAIILANLSFVSLTHLYHNPKAIPQTITDHSQTKTAKNRLIK